jgi:16S rRNA processing protein RimM
VPDVAVGGEDRLLEVGRISRAHGLRGEVVVKLVSNVEGRLAVGSRLTCRATGAGGSGGGEGAGAEPDRVLVVGAVRDFKDAHLVVFDGVATREDAERLRGARLLASPVADREAYFVHELVGCEVVEVDGTPRGRAVAVQANPASDLLVIEDGTLVPLRFVVGHDEQRIVVDVPAGLFE